MQGVQVSSTMSSQGKFIFFYLKMCLLKNFLFALFYFILFYIFFIYIVIETIYII